MSSIIAPHVYADYICSRSLHIVAYSHTLPTITSGTRLCQVSADIVPEFHLYQAFMQIRYPDTAPTEVRKYDYDERCIAWIEG